MFNLLGWLYDKIWRVYNLFDWIYDRVVSAAVNAYSWARNAAQDAYSWARSYATNLFNNAKAAAEGLVEGIRNLAWMLYDWGREFASNLFSQAANSIMYWYNRAKLGAEALAKGVSDLALVLFTRSTEAAEALVNGVAATAEALFNRAAHDTTQLFDQVNTEIQDLKSILRADTPDGIKSLVTIFQDPAGWIFSLLLSQFLTFFDYTVGSALGTVKYSLPPAPALGVGATGGVFLPSPPVGTAGLVAPLTSLRISGYTFDNPPGHRGIDFGLAFRSPIFAMHDGIVGSAGWSTVGYGYTVTIQGGKWWSRYAHLDEVGVHPGDRVSAGDIIGLGNSTGNSSGNHLHLEIKKHGAFVDPLSVL